MALPQGDFSRLLRELRGAGPVDRLRLLGRSISALRGLSPWDRKILLRMAGFEGAEALVERLAGDDPETARALTRVLERLEAHPDDLERTVRNLGDPKRRGEAVDELLETLDRATADETPAVGAAAEDEVAAPLPAGAVQPEPAPAEAGPWQDPVAAFAAPVPEGAELPPPQGPPSASAPEAAVPPAPPGPPAGEPVPVSAPPPPTGEPAAAEPEPPEPMEPPAPPEPIRAPRPRAGVPSPEPAPAPEAPSAVAALEGLLDLRRRLDAGRRPTAGELRRWLERELPFPWARRRAIQAWLAGGGAGDDLEAILDLVDTLPPGSDRTWCLASLAGARPWSAAAWRRITDAAASPEKRRHLELRRRHS